MYFKIRNLTNFQMDKIDKIYYINLERRFDRKEHIENEFEKMKISSDKICRFNAIEHEQGCIGCGLSHIGVLDDAIKNDYQNIIIFEDDFEFLISSDHFSTILVRLFEREFNACLLSYNVPIVRRLDNDFSEIITAQTASGYVVNKNLMKELRDIFQQGVNLLSQHGRKYGYHIDVIWHKLQGVNKKFLMSNVRVGKQMASYSDIEEQFVDHKC